MVKKAKPITSDKRQLAALATLLGLMQAASKLSGELEELAQGIGGSLDEIVEAAGIPFSDVHTTYAQGSKRSKRTARRAKG